MGSVCWLAVLVSSLRTRVSDEHWTVRCEAVQILADAASTAYLTWFVRRLIERVAKTALAVFQPLSRRESTAES